MGGKKQGGIVTTTVDGERFIIPWEFTIHGHMLAV